MLEWDLSGVFWFLGIGFIGEGIVGYYCLEVRYVVVEFQGKMGRGVWEKLFVKRKVKGRI